MEFLWEYFAPLKGTLIQWTESLAFIQRAVTLVQICPFLIKFPEERNFLR